MKILITGANGMLAKAVRNEFSSDELILTDVEDLDITNLEAVQKYVADVSQQKTKNSSNQKHNDFLASLRVSETKPPVIQYDNVNKHNIISIEK